MVFPPRRLQLIAVSAAVLIAGVGAAGWTWHEAERNVRADLLAGARRCAAAFGEDELRSLSATREDLGSPVYVVTKARLVALKDAQPGVRRIYLVRRQPVTGAGVLLAGSADAVLPGDEAGPVSGAGGVILAGAWMTGFAPVGTDAGDAAQATDILGIEVANDPWGDGLAWHVLGAAVVVWLLLGVPAGLWSAGRRRSSRDDALRMLAGAVEQSRSALLITDPQGRIEYVNRGACEQTGYGRGELMRRDWGEFRAKETPPEVVADMAAAACDGRSWEGEWVIRRKDAKPGAVRGTVTPVKDELGKAVHFITTFQGGAATKRAEPGAQAKGEFLATLGHELRTPLNGIVRFADLLLNTPLIAEQRSHVQTISANGQALLKLTGNLLDYSWLEAGRMPLDAQPCDVRELIEGVLDLVSGQAAGKDLVLLHRVAPDVPEIVEIDGGRLRQVLVNLTGNAVKFTAAGEVSVEVGMRADERSAGGVFLEFKVRDTGPGIAVADQGRLFQPFSQISLAVGRRHGGTGLGLVISRSLVRLMGGEITLESTPGVGTVFQFHVSARPLDTPSMPPALEGRRVALVVGHAGLRSEIAAVVASAGGTPETRTAEQLEGADLVVMDCGPELAARVTQVPPGGFPWPVGRTLGLIADSLGADERRQLRPFFRLLITKPLHHEAMVSALKSCRGAAESGREQPQLGLRLLLVDDNPANLRLLQGISGVLGCESTAAAGGQEGFEAVARGERYDAVLLDLQMPEVDGIEVLRRLRSGEAGPEARDLWITIVTADARTETRSALFELGCDDFITKPVTVKTCLAALQRVVRNRPNRP